MLDSCKMISFFLSERFEPHRKDVLFAHINDSDQPVHSLAKAL